MSEAPKKIWIDVDYEMPYWFKESTSKDYVTTDTLYIRADVVEEMRKALEYSINYMCDTSEYQNRVEMILKDLDSYR